MHATFFFRVDGVVPSNRRGKEVNMKRKVLIVCAIIALCSIVSYLAYVMYYLPKQIMLIDNRMLAIQQAISELSKDQLLLSQTVSDITDRAVETDRGKELTVREMLSNPVINRLALNYLGRDFSSQKSMFEGQIKHIKAVSKSQLGVRQKKDKAESELKDKLKKLESKKRFLLQTRTTAVSGRNYEQWASWQREMEDIDSQIYYLRGLVLGKDMQKGDAGNTSEGIRINKDKTIFQVASEYERNTIVQLENTIVARRSSYMKEESRAILLRDRLNVISVWPLSNLINKNY